MNKYLIIAYSEWSNGKCLLPQVEECIAAKDLDNAREIANKKYHKYQNVAVFEWLYR